MNNTAAMVLMTRNHGHSTGGGDLSAIGGVIVVLVMLQFFQLVFLFAEIFTGSTLSRKEIFMWLFIPTPVYLLIVLVRAINEAR